jgi:transposase
MPLKTKTVTVSEVRKLYVITYENEEGLMNVSRLSTNIYNAVQWVMRSKGISLNQVLSVVHQDD